jgi:hypothetical protein
MEISSLFDIIIDNINEYNKQNGQLPLYIKDNIIKTLATFHIQLKKSDGETIRKCLCNHPNFMNKLTNMYIKEWHTTEKRWNFGIVYLLEILIDKGITKEDIGFSNDKFIQKIREYLMNNYYTYHYVNSVNSKIHNTNQRNYVSSWNVYLYYQQDDEEIKKLLEKQNIEPKETQNTDSRPKLIKKKIEDVFKVNHNTIPGGHTVNTWC